MSKFIHLQQSALVFKGRFVGRFILDGIGSCIQCLLSDIPGHFITIREGGYQSSFR